MSALSDYLENELVNGLFRTTTWSAWAISTAYSAGDLVYASTPDGNVYECVVGGTSGGSEPTWQTSFGADTTDNTVTWRTMGVGPRKRPLYTALFTATPSDSGGGTEVTGGSYARAVLNPSNANWNATGGTDGLTDNAAEITFPTPTANWGTVTSFGIFDAATSGNLLLWGALTASKTINNGDPAPKFSIGDLDITFA